MAARLAWWTIPATAVVLVRVLTLEPRLPATADGPASAAQVAAAHAPIGVVQLRDASGRRTVPVAIGGDGALVLQLPAGAAAQRVGFRLERHVGDGGVPELWLEGNPRIAADATMRISGVPAGRYAVEVAFESDGERHTVRCADFTAPGTVDLSR